MGNFQQRFHRLAGVERRTVVELNIRAQSELPTLEARGVLPGERQRRLGGAFFIKPDQRLKNQRSNMLFDRLHR